MQEPVRDNEEIKELDVEHLRWAIDQRGEIQKSLLAIYECIKRHHVSTANIDTQHMLNYLVGAAFSLWRAVFLADTFRNYEAIQKSQLGFLEKLLSDNSISFADDKNNRGWSVGYYLENSKLRLVQAAHYSDAHSKTKLTEELRSYLHLSAWDKDLIRFEWESAHFVLRRLLQVICPETALQPTKPAIPTNPLGI